MGRGGAWPAILFLVGASLVAAEPTPSEPAIPNARTPLAGVRSGGQPTPEQIEEAAGAGFRTVINLRADGEPGFEWEREAVERLGMQYVHIPVAGAPGLTHENVERLDTALADARQRGPALLHCASGNRIGAMLALREAWVRGAGPSDALRFGLDAGLTKLEPDVRALLGLPAADAVPSGPTAPTP